MAASDFYLNYNGQAYFEKAVGSPKFSFGENNRCVRQLGVPWNGSYCGEGNTLDGMTVVLNAAEAFLGFPSVAQLDQAVPNFTYVSRPLPLSLRKAGRQRGFYFAKAIQEAEGRVPAGLDPSLLNSYDACLMSVVFEAPLYQHLGDHELITAINSNGGPSVWFPDESSLLRMCSPKEKPGGKYQTLPSNSGFYFQESIGAGFGHTVTLPPTGPAVKGGPGQDLLCTSTLTVLLEDSDLMITWHDVPASVMPRTAIQQCRGGTNMWPLGHPGSYFGTKPAYTLQMLAPEYTFHRNIVDEMLVDIGYRFKHFPHGANAFFNKNKSPAPGYSMMYAYNGGPVPQAPNIPRFFQPANFNNLFRPEGFRLPPGWTEPTYGQDVTKYQ